LTALELVNALLMLNTKKDAEVVIEIDFISTVHNPEIYKIVDVTTTQEGKVRLEWG